LTVLRSRISGLQPSPDECVAAINRTINLLEISLGDIRDLLGTFRAPEFAGSELTEIIEDIVIQHETFTSSAVTLEMSKPFPKSVSLPVKIALCRILQESLSNVRRHSGVQDATVKLWSKKGRLFLEVSDHGCGFEPPPLSGPQATKRHEHIGLRGMRERATLVGGELFVESHPGTGSAFAWRFRLMTDAPQIRIVLADDHALVLEGLLALLAAEPDLRVVATATDGERLLEAVRRFTPDVVAIDLQMPFMDGLTCLHHIRAEELPVRVLVISAFEDAQSLRTAVEGGADGFALKTDSPEMTLAAIRQVARGHLVFPAAVRRWLIRTPADDPDALTDREEAVLALVAEGKSNAQIGAALNLSENTIKFHLKNLFSKLGVTNRTEAAAKFHKR